MAARLGIPSPPRARADASFVQEKVLEIPQPKPSRGQARREAAAPIQKESSSEQAAVDTRRVTRSLSSSLQTREPAASTGPTGSSGVEKKQAGAATGKGTKKVTTSRILARGARGGSISFA